ncbi:MAG: hypothetical protein GXY49_14240 [Syntrophomonadaceae bacterium]|jgi:hypothetical protein|nr:hypothetical protein [Syntrophomonadaceae bacterium]
MKKRILAFVLVAVCSLLTLFQPSVVMADGETAVPNSDGVEIVNLGQKTITNNGVILAYRSEDEAQVDSIQFFNQSTIVQKQASGKYYRTVAYEMALADANKTPLTDYKTYDYDQYRRAHMAFMQKFIKDKGMSFGKPYASKEILYRDYLLKNFPAEQLDTAKYLIVNGIIEIYQINADGSDTVLYTINSSNKDKYYPEGFESLRSDILTRYVLVDLHPPVPDYWPSVPSLTYTGEPGSKITIPAMVYNSGRQDITDFAVAWDGSGWQNPVYKTDNLSIDNGQKVDTPFTVTVPNATTKLWLKVNTDGQTPASEINQSNNTICVTVEPTGVDLALFMDALPPSIDIPWTMTSYPGEIAVTAVRNGYDTNPIDATITVYTPFGTKTLNVTGIKGDEDQEFTIDCPVSAAGNYVFNGIIEPTGGLTDIDPSNNQASCTMVITKMAAPKMPKIEVESEIKGQLGG